MSTVSVIFRIGIVATLLMPRHHEITPLRTGSEADPAVAKQPDRRSLRGGAAASNTDAIGARVGARTKPAAGYTDRIIGQRIRALRLKAGLAQGKLAARIGVTCQQLQKYERGANRVSVVRLLRIADALGLGVRLFLPARYR